MKKILGLDLGTNSIGAALINMPESINDYGNDGNIEWIGSRIPKKYRKKVFLKTIERN
jgi:CRISPR/Cas system Type II protein with McrA/HNH and RuvC-like nuclease domain